MSVLVCTHVEEARADVHIDITRQVLADGTREVIINPLHNSGGDAEVFRCKERMLQHVDSILEREREA